MGTRAFKRRTGTKYIKSCKDGKIFHIHFKYTPAENCGFSTGDIQLVLVNIECTSLVHVSTYRDKLSLNVLSLTTITSLVFVFCELSLTVKREILIFEI